MARKQIELIRAESDGSGTDQRETTNRRRHEQLKVKLWNRQCPETPCSSPVAMAPHAATGCLHPPAMPAALTAETLPVVETFHSLQGEGLHSGRSAFFIRLAGCRVGCSWCDTKHSWPESVHPHIPFSELTAQVRAAAAAGAGFVVVTGGEPLHHDLTALCTSLRELELPLHLETSGIDPLTGRFDWITLSPKRHAPPRAELLAACQELKVVVHEPDDLIFAEAMAAATAKARGPDLPAPALLLQPGWQSSEGQALAVAQVQANPRWRLSLQSHKLLGVR